MNMSMNKKKSTYIPANTSHRPNAVTMLAQRCWPILKQHWANDSCLLGCSMFVAGPDGSFDLVVARNSEVLGSNPGPVRYLSSTYTVLQAVQRPGVCGAVYSTVNYEEPLKL